MSIVGALKNNVIFLLLTFVCVMSLVCISNKAYASSVTDVNLALNKSVTVSSSTSCTSIEGATAISSAVNGIISYTNSSPCDRWTTWANPAPDWLAIDFGAPTIFNQIKLYIYNDNGGVQPPANYVIQYWDGNNSDWVDVTHASSSPELPAEQLNIVDFDVVTSDKLRVEFTRGNAAVGLTEIEVYLHYTPEDETAASAVMAQIDQLPSKDAVALTDQAVIEAARTAYNGLTANQQSLVVNMSKLTAAETAITTLKTLPSEDVGVQSAFGNGAGDTIKLKLLTVVDATYGVQADKFQIIADSVTYAVYGAVYDPTDSSQQTIKLTVSSSVLQSASSVVLSVQSGAFITGNMKLNNANSAIPVLTFKNLDYNQDHLIGVDDLVQIIGNPNWQVDVNQDGSFDKKDIESMLGQLSWRIVD